MVLKYTLHLSRKATRSAAAEASRSLAIPTSAARTVATTTTIRVLRCLSSCGHDGDMGLKRWSELYRFTFRVSDFKPCFFWLKEIEKYIMDLID